MTVLHEFWNQAASEKASTSRNQNFHCVLPLVSEIRMACMARSRISLRTADVGGATLRSQAVTCSKEAAFAAHILGKAFTQVCNRRLISAD